MNEKTARKVLVVLAVAIVLIGVAAIFSIYFAIDNGRLQGENDGLKTQVEDQNEEMSCLIAVLREEIGFRDAHIERLESHITQSDMADAPVILAVNPIALAESECGMVEKGEG